MFSSTPRARRLLPLQRGTCSLCGGPDQRYHQCESVEGNATRFADLPPQDAALNTQARPAVRLEEAERVGIGRERQPGRISCETTSQPRAAYMPVGNVIDRLSSINNKSAGTVPIC